MIERDHAAAMRGGWSGALGSILAGGVTGFAIGYESGLTWATDVWGGTDPGAAQAVASVVVASAACGLAVALTVSRTARSAAVRAALRVALPLGAVTLFAATGAVCITGALVVPIASGWPARRGPATPVPGAGPPASHPRNAVCAPDAPGSRRLDSRDREVS